MSKKSDDSNLDDYINNSMAEYTKDASILYEDEDTPRLKNNKGK